METHLLKCDQCSYNGLGLRFLRIHKIAHARQKQAAALASQKKLQCELCGTEVLAKYGLKSHMEIVHGKHAFKCDLCDYTCSHKNYLAQHKKGHFLTLQDCPICLRKVKFLKKHLWRCQQKQKGIKHPCDQCDKTFGEASSLKTHIAQVHEQIKNFVCDACDYKTYTAFNLRLHVTKVHTKETLEHVCPLCKATSNSIEQHLKTFHFDYYRRQLEGKKQSESKNDDGGLSDQSTVGGAAASGPEG